MRPSLSGSIFQRAIGALEIMTVYLGWRLGLYAAISSGDWTSPEQLAAMTNTHVRYVREWLEQQAVAGFLETEESEVGNRVFRLPLNHLGVLVDETSTDFAGHLVVDVARVARVLPCLVEAFQSGQTPPSLGWPPEGKPDVNKAIFLGPMAKVWLPRVDAVHSMLMTRNCCVADLGCGLGWSSIAIARSYPTAKVIGLDVDGEAIEKARWNAVESSALVEFHVMSALDVGTLGCFDVVTIFEALHDMSHPVNVLHNARLALRKDTGVILIAEERVADGYFAPGDECERFFYAWSVLACLPNTMRTDGDLACGAVLRPHKLKGYAEAAGLTCEEVCMDSKLWRFYLLSPKK